MSGNSSNAQLRRDCTRSASSRSRTLWSSCLLMYVQLFSRGTYLQQLCEEYEAIHQVNEVTGKTLKRKAEYRPYLREQVTTAQMAVQAGVATEAQRKRCKGLEIQLQWRTVKDAEKVTIVPFVPTCTFLTWPTGS